LGNSAPLLWKLSCIFIVELDNTIFIFGAGASNDCVSDGTIVLDENWKPPLGNDLLKSTNEYDALMRTYGEFISLAGEIRIAVYNQHTKRQKSLEDYMVEIKEKSQSEDDRVRVNRCRQLVYLRFYLRMLMQRCSTNYVKTSNNYSVLISRLSDIRRDSEVTFLSFNYDSLIEQEFIRQNIWQSEVTLNSYIDSEIPLIKLHGSVGWIYRINTGPEDLQGNFFPWLFKKYPDTEPDVRSLSIEIDEDWGKNVNNIKQCRASYIHYPAIAIPLNKKSEFVCPTSHLEKLKVSLASVKNVVVIGWKGKEDTFCKLLSLCKPNRPRLIVIGKGSAEKTAADICVDHMNNARRLHFDEGFSGFMHSHDDQALDNLLSGNWRGLV